jgi:hypothetical protein
METQWMESTPHLLNHITLKSCSVNGECSPLPLPMLAKKVALQIGSVPYVACLLTGFEHLANFSPYL